MHGGNDRVTIDEEEWVPEDEAGFIWSNDKDENLQPAPVDCVHNDENRSKVAGKSVSLRQI